MEQSPLCEMHWSTKASALINLLAFKMPTKASFWFCVAIMLAQLPLWNVFSAKHMKWYPFVGIGSNHLSCLPGPTWSFFSIPGNLANFTHWMVIVINNTMASYACHTLKKIINKAGNNSWRGLLGGGILPMECPWSSAGTYITAFWVPSQTAFPHPVF